ncbi:MAG TPA: hypothetical protein VFD59_11270 [Nocardioidaceae bacterium]|nr:hypothetical protein [Nocardioidaceae bacterium]
MGGFTHERRRGRSAARSPDRDLSAVMPLTLSLDALGDGRWSDLGTQDVPVDQIVGTVSRTK